MGKSSDGGDQPVYNAARQERGDLRVVPDLGGATMLIDLSFGL
jgi:hypothetical protein